uniref:Myb/SANT-like domain-containing protein n=1 Tax=Ananas comosus var. bracteatus TaxID=296719 RepID=A0A6V7PJL7_ANACO|nr:unnamed protein product [Ananas comosus var. bracteatus]
MSIQQNFEANDKQETKNFKWTNEMSDFLIEFLVHQASIGMKVDKSFKRPAFVAAARAVSSEFQVSCNWTKAHPKDICYLNCPIQHYDELAIICGDDQATGEFALDDPNTINLDEEDNNDDGDDFGLEYLYSEESEHISPTTPSQGHKRQNPNRPVTKSGIGTTSKAKKQNIQIQNFYY